VVLTRRSATLELVLGFVLGLVLLGGCDESLFGTRGHGNGGGGDDDGGVTGCSAPCNADAAAEFDGTAGGAHGRWRYLDDHRDRSWAAMTVGNQVMKGADPGVQITTCRAFPDADACRTLANALLISTAVPSANDPAIELTVAEAQVLELHVEALVPGGGGDQTVRLYRNSREDELFTGIATPGTVLDHKITVDVVPGDRLLVSVGSKVAGTANVGLNLFASGTGAPFPASCQVTVPFASAAGAAVVDLCGNTVFTHYNPAGTAPVALDVGPFPEQGKGTILSLGEYFAWGPKGIPMPPVLDWRQDVTVQLWTKADPVSSSRPTFLFSDLDPDYGSGIELSLTQGGTVALNVDMASCDTPTSLGTVTAGGSYPNSDQWHFIRAVRTGGALHVCLDGAPLMKAAINKPCTQPSNYPLLLGAKPSSGEASFSGRIDDVRVFTGALPCN
jgi:hypothetical protein